MSGRSTPVAKLSGTNRRGAPPKKLNAATCEDTHDAASIDNTGRTNICREHANTITNAHTRRARCVTGSNQVPMNP